jgi:lysophospholipase L1-like esterase
VTSISWLTALAGVCILAGIGAELAARWWIHRRSRYYVLPPGLRLRLRPDPTVFPQLERDVRFEVNRDGERGDDVPRSADGLFRVLVAGGSQPEGYLLDQDSNWPGALQRLLRTPENRAALGARQVHVGSVARSGVGSEALDLIFKQLLPRYPPLSAIIILVGASDVLRWLEVGAPPSPPPPVRVADVFRCHPELTFGWRPRRLALVELVLRLRRRWLQPVEVHERACRWMAKARSMRARATVIRTATPDPTPMLAHFDSNLRRAIQRARAHADRVIVVRQPWFARPSSPDELALMWHGGAGQAWVEEVTTFYSLEVLSDLMALLDARAAHIARGLDVEQLDLMPVLDASTRTYYDFFHATPAGTPIIAAAVAAAVLRRPTSSSADPAARGANLPDFKPAELRKTAS